MRDYVLYQIFTNRFVLILLLTFTATASADWGSYTPTPKFVPQMSDSSNTETNNPWHTSGKQRNAPGFWMPPQNTYQQHGQQPVPQQPQYQKPFNETFYNAVPYESRQNDNVTGERYVTPEIIDALNRQEAQYYYNLQRQRREMQWIQNNYAPLHQQQVQQPATYSMGGVNPIYDVPGVSPWANAPDVLYRGEEYSWLPNEAFGGLPPMTVPLLGNDNGLGQSPLDGFGNNVNNKVFNPFTFLQNGN